MLYRRGRGGYGVREAVAGELDETGHGREAGAEDGGGDFGKANRG